MYKILDPNNLDFKKTNGKEKIRCPECDADRSDKKDKSLLYNHDEKRGKCFYCETLVFEKEEQEPNNYEEPSQSIKTEYSPKFIDYAKSRGISEETLRKFYVTEEYYYQPKKGKKVNNICFNYYEWDRLVNKKFRSGDKCFTQIANAKSIFYNLNATIGQDEVIIVEGEFDVLALYEAGYKNVVSVPNGANNNDDYWKNSKSFLDKVKSFIIAVDNDTKGNELKENIGQRLGRFKCKVVEWTQKDANEELLKGNIKKCIDNAKRFPVSGVMTVNDLYGQIVDLYDNGLPKTIKPKQPRWSGVNNIFSTMNGQLTVFTGIPSHGKSSVVDDYVLSLCNDLKLKASWFSPEHSPKELHQANFAQCVIGKPFWGEGRMSKSELESYRNWANERVYITSQDESEPTWDWLFERMEEQVYAYGINIFVIDAFNKIIMKSGQKTEIDLVLSRLTAFCIRNNVQIYLVVHPTKMQKKQDGTYEVPSLYDCSGSADFRNQTHNGVSIYRIFEDEKSEGETLFINAKTKFKFQGVINGQCSMQYCVRNGRFYTNYEEPLYSYIQEKQEEINYNKPINGNESMEEFLNSDDAPF